MFITLGGGNIMVYHQGWDCHINILQGKEEYLMQNTKVKSVCLDIIETVNC